MNRRLAGLMAVAVLLGGYLGLEYLGYFRAGGGGLSAVLGGGGSRAAGVKLNPLQGLDPKAFAAIVDRPLFNPSRQPRPVEQPPAPVTPVAEPPQQPPPPPPPPQAQGPGPEDYRLLGVASGPDGRIAALRIAASGDVVYLRKGESVDSWNVVDIGERTVAIGTPENPVTFSLFTTTDQAAGDQQNDPAMGSQGEAPPQPLSMQPPMPPSMPPPLPLPMPHPGRSGGQRYQHSVPDQHDLTGPGG